MMGLLDNVFAVTRDGREHLMWSTYGSAHAGEKIQDTQKVFDRIKEMNLNPEDVKEIKIKLLDRYNAEGQLVGYFHYMNKTRG